MKRKISTLLMSMCMLMVSAFSFGCGEVKVTLSTEDNITSLKPGESTQIIMDVTDNEDIVLEINDGEEYATLSADGILTIKDDATAGEIVKVVATLDEKIVSNILEITIDEEEVVALTGLTLSAFPNVANVEKNDQIQLTTTATPTNTTEDIELVITAGSEHATIAGNILTIKSTATIGAQIKVRAEGETMNSSELTFTVVASDAEKRYIQTDNSKTIDSASSTAHTLSVEILDGDMDEVTGETVSYTITEGSEYLAISHENGQTCDLQVLGHGTAKVRVSVAGANDKIVTINCIKAPDTILLPEALVEKTNIEFSSGINQDIDGFVFTAFGTNVCQDMAYAVEKWNGTAYASTTAGTLSGGKLKFTETGKYRVTATSTSGSSRAVSKEVVFNVNEGINVSTYADFKTNVEAGNIVNILNLTNKNGTYNYDLVPASILAGTQTETNYTEAQIAVKGKNVRINGNGFRLDVSKLAYYASNVKEYGTLLSIQATDELALEYETNNCQTESDKNAKKRSLTQADYFVSINNLDILGNSHVDGRINDKAYNPAESLALDNNSKPTGVLRSSFDRGIHIGRDSIFVAYQVSMDNVEVGGFTAGMRFCHAVNSTITNSTVGDCFQNGIETVASEITLTNMTYGLCGATGIEITPDEAVYAGLNFSNTQTITFAGTISMDASALNAGNTPYMQWFAEKNGMSVATIIQGSMIAALGGDPLSEDDPTPEQMLKMSNVMNDGKVGIIALIFEGDNASRLQYSNELNDGIINFTSLQGSGDNHHYVELNLVYDLGKALLFNLNYLSQD